MEIKDLFETSIIPFIGWLSAAVFTNTKRVQRLRSIGEAFDKISQELTDFSENSCPHKRLISAVRLRRFFDKNGEYSTRSLWKSTCPYEKDALSVISALLKTDIGNDDPQLQKALADGLAYASDISGVDLQGADLTNSFLGQKSGDKEVTLCELDFFNAKLIKASLKQANCSGAKFVQAEMMDSVLDQGDFQSADFRGAKLNRARFKKANLSNANFEGADLEKVNFSEANLQGANFKGCKLEGARFAGAKNIPELISSHLNEAH